MPSFRELHKLHNPDFGDAGPTLSAIFFSVSLGISICDLTNMAKSPNPPAIRQTVQWVAEMKAADLYLVKRTDTSYIDRNRYAIRKNVSF